MQKRKQTVSDPIPKARYGVRLLNLKVMVIEIGAVGVINVD